MPKPEKVRNPNAIPSDGDSGADATSTQRSASGVPSIPRVPEVTGGSEAATTALQIFNSRDDGWLRITGADNGKVVYYKWKYTAGKCQGNYCMFVDDGSNPARALHGLLEKVEFCDVGVHTCVRDRFYQ